MTRTAFAVVAGALLLFLFVYIVVLPGVTRGGWAEVIGVVALVGAIVLAERWLRQRARR